MTDHTLKKIFAEMRAIDAKNIPSFPRVLHKANPQNGASTPSAWIPFAFAASAALLAAVLFFSVVSKKEIHSSDELTHWASISDWSAPSDALLAESSSSPLSTSSDALLEALPSSSSTDKNL